MKKIAIWLLCLFCFFSLGACAQKEEGQETVNPYFTGKVLEIYENSCLVEVTDTGNGNFFVGEKVVVHTAGVDTPDYAVDDCLTISFDGKVALSYPPQIFSVTIISKTDGKE